MTKRELTELLLKRFYENFAQNTAVIVIDNQAFDALYQLSIGNTDSLTKDEIEKVIFRAAYVVEYIYFNHNHYFELYTEPFFDDFRNTTSKSAKRHFAKIMADLLLHKTPTIPQCEAIAESCAQWIIEPQIKVAVQIWSVEVLIILKNKIEWINDILPDLFEFIEKNSTPGLICRLKTWRDTILS